MTLESREARSAARFGPFPPMRESDDVTPVRATDADGSAAHVHVEYHGRFDRPGPLRRLRFRFGVWLLKPHWLPLLENYNRAADTETHPKGNAERCAYIAIGIKYAIGVTRWGRYK